MNKHNTKPLVTAIGSAFVAATALSAIALASAASATENPFQADQLRSGYMLADGHAEGKCGEGKCGEGKAKKEGKCGEGKCGEGKAKAEGKCGEGKLMPRERVVKTKPKPKVSAVVKKRIVKANVVGPASGPVV